MVVESSVHKTMYLFCKKKPKSDWQADLSAVMKLTVTHTFWRATIYKLSSYVDTLMASADGPIQGAKWDPLVLLIYCFSCEYKYVDIWHARQDIENK